MPHVYQDRDGAFSTAAQRPLRSSCACSSPARQAPLMLSLDRMRLALEGAEGAQRPCADAGAPRQQPHCGVVSSWSTAVAHSPRRRHASAVVLTHNCLLCRCPTRGESRALPSLQRCRGKA